MSKVETSGVTVVDLPLTDIFSDPNFNCRGPVLPIDVTELARSLADTGLQSPVIVQPYNKAKGKKWRLVIGHRRLLAASLLRWSTIPAIIRADLSEIDASVFNISENIQRQQLNILQEAKAVQSLKQIGLSSKEVAGRLGQSLTWLTVRELLLDLPEDIQFEAAAGMLSQQQIREIYDEALPEVRYEMVRMIKEAKEKGERIPPKKKIRIKSALSRRVRDREDIFELMDRIQESVGNSFATRCLAWCAGEISDWDIYLDIKQQAHIKGISYSIPSDVISPASSVMLLQGIEN